jgi:hypothetical protein
MKIMLRGIRMKLGEVPPHWELYASLNPKRFTMFMEEINYLTGHETIDPDLFTFLRYFIAFKNGLGYCEKFNHAYLLTKGYTPEQLDAFVESKENLPLDDKHKALFKTAVEAMEDPASLTSDSMEKMYVLGWGDGDIFDAIDHAAFLFKFHKILEVYLKV